MNKCRLDARFDCHPLMRTCDLCINNPINGVARLREALETAVRDERSACAEIASLRSGYCLRMAERCDDKHVRDCWLEAKVEAMVIRDQILHRRYTKAALQAPETPFDANTPAEGLKSEGRATGPVTMGQGKDGEE